MHFVYLYIDLFLFILIHFYHLFVSFFVLLLLFCTVKSAISETVQLLQNGVQEKVLLTLICCLGTAKCWLGKSSVLGCELLLRFIFLIQKKFLRFAICCIFNGKREIKSYWKKLGKRKQYLISLL